MTAFKDSILSGIPNEIPQKKEYDLSINHAPKRKDILNADEKKLALKNALRYFPKEQHTFLAEEFANELNELYEDLNGDIFISADKKGIFRVNFTNFR